MKAKILDGKRIASEIKAKVRVEAEEFYAKTGRKIGLAVILVGDKPASCVYVKNKIKAADECFVRSFAYYLPKETREEELIELIKKINTDERIDGLLIQLPLPRHIRQNYVLGNILPEKDADGFLAVNAGNLMLGNPALNACTPCGIISLIEHTDVEIEGKNAVVIGRSNIVGKPIALMLIDRNATVTVCHSKTRDLKDITKKADILVVAVGQEMFVTADMVKEGAIVIDVGMNRLDGELCGDVDFDKVAEVAGYITPVPGGVGPMTIAMLMSNVSMAAKRLLD